MIHVVVSCSDRKSMPSAPQLRASVLPRGSFGKRTASWMKRAGQAPGLATAASLYQGEHWSVARDLALQDGIELWVASGGFGLISQGAKICGYSATFTPGCADTVTLASTAKAIDRERKQWWTALQALKSPDHRSSIPQLAAEGSVVIAASRPYLSAMESEILDAALLAPRRVMISTVGPVPTRLQSLCAGGDGSLRNVLGGSMQAVNARLAQRIVTTIADKDLTVDAARRLTASLLTGAAPLIRFNRRTLTDQEVRAYIADAIGNSNGITTSCSSLIRVFRDAGMACEQSRFRDLFHQVRERQ